MNHSTVLDNVFLILIQIIKNPSGTCKKGRLKLVNDSKYDISSIIIVIEHFDEKGKSSSVTKKVLYDIVKSGGYKIFEWIEFDCFNCNKRKFKILF